MGTVSYESGDSDVGHQQTPTEHPPSQIRRPTSLRIKSKSKTTADAHSSQLISTRNTRTKDPKSTPSKTPKTEQKKKTQDEELPSRKDGKVKHPDITEILLQLVEHLRQHSKDHPTAAGDCLNLFLSTIHEQDKTLQNLKQLQMDTKLVNQIECILGEKPMDLTTAISYMKKTEKLKDPNTELLNEPSLHEALRQLIKQLKQHTAHNNKMAEKYQLYIIKLLTQRKELIDSTKEHRNADLIEVTTEQSFSPTLQLNAEKVSDSPEITEKVAELVQKTNKVETCENAKTQLNAAEEISVDTMDSDPQILQKLKEEIEKLKQQLSQKDKVIEEQTKKLQKETLHQKDQISPSQLRDRILTNLQVLTSYFSESDGINQKTVEDLTTYVRTLLSITEEKTQKLIDLQEEFKCQQLYVESLHERESSSTILKNELVKIMNEHKAHITSLFNQQSDHLQNKFNSPTYAEKISRKPVETLIIKRKDVNLTAQTLERKIFNLGIEDLAIQDCIRTRSGNLQLKCHKKEDAQFITEKLKKSELKDQLDIIQKKQRIIIFSIPQQITEEELKRALQKKLSNRADIQFIKKIDTRDSYHQTIEMDMASANFLISSKKLLICMHSCPIRRYISLPRCYRCQGLGHVASSCSKKNEIRCEFCGQKHDSRQCELRDHADKHRCFNCITYNQTHGRDINIKHKASSSDCSYYRKKLSEKRSSVYNSK